MQDHLNTHHTRSFYEHLPAGQAFELAQRFEFHSTPKSARWLNMIEIELSTLARGCLHRRIPTLEQLQAEVLALIQQRHERQIPIQWQFSITAARDKLSRHYTQLNEGNLKLKMSLNLIYRILDRLLLIFYTWLDIMK